MKQRVRRSHLAWIRSIFPRVQFVRQMGIRISRLGSGQATLVVDTRPEHLQPQGAVHGGVIATLADTAVAMALFTLVPPMTQMATVEMSINYLTPHRGGRLRAEASILRKGKRVAVGEVDVWNSARQRVAKALVTYSIREHKEK